MTSKFLFPAIVLMLVFSARENTFAQVDPQEEAAKILEKFSQKAFSEEGFSASFNFASEDPVLKKSDTWQGNLWIKKNKYKVVTSSLVLLSDGVKRWQYLPEVNEVNVQLCSRLAPDEEEWMISNPGAFFSIYKKNYTAVRIGLTTLQQRKVEEIDLLPKSNKTEIARIKMWIDPGTSELISVRVFQKSGVQYSLAFRNYRWGEPLPEKEYQFDASLYPGVEVVEMDL